MTIVTAGADAAHLLGHDFGRPALLKEALTHPSALPAAQKGRRRARRHAGPRDYERLEFLGDRVLGLVVADLLWRRFDAEPEGPLTRRHAQLVRRETLAAVAIEIGLDRGDFARLAREFEQCRRVASGKAGLDTGGKLHARGSPGERNMVCRKGALEEHPGKAGARLASGSRGCKPGRPAGLDEGNPPRAGEDQPLGAHL